MQSVRRALHTLGQRSRPASYSGQPMVSIVIPCYNYGHYLSDCVNSVATQCNVRLDIIVIDDASTDGSGEVAESMGVHDPRVTVIRHAQNIGHIATYNEGLGRAKGDYVVLLSADDLLTPGSLTRAVALMEANPSVGLVYGHPVSFSQPFPPPPQLRARSWSIWPGAYWIASQCRRGLNCIYSPEAVVRTSVQWKVGGYQRSLPHTADLEMWLRIAAVSDVGHINGADQAYRRVHAASMLQTNYTDFLEDLRGRKAAYERFFDGALDTFAGSRQSQRIAWCRLAEEALEHACKLLSGSQDSAIRAMEYVRFAQELYPRHYTLAVWRECILRLKAQRTPIDLVRCQAYEMRRELLDRIRFRRWHWRGI